MPFSAPSPAGVQFHPTEVKRAQPHVCADLRHIYFSQSIQEESAGVGVGYVIGASRGVRSCIVRDGGFVCLLT